MQEEVENRTVNLAITVTKLAARNIANAGLAYLRHRKSRSAAPRQGRQTVKQLIRQGQGASVMEVARTDLKGFERAARKYGVDYAIRKDETGRMPKYIVFFKARDADALTAAFKEYSAFAMKKRRTRRPSVLRQLRKLKEAALAIPSKIRHKERTL